MTTSVLNTKTSEVRHKISNARSLVKKSDYEAEISEIEKKYFNDSD